MTSRTLFFALILASSARFLNGALIFQTGFETSDSPGYVTGQLNGQNGWCCNTVGVVENSTVFAGSQGVQFNASGTTGQSADAHGLPYTATGNPDYIVTMSTEFMQSATGSSSLWDVLVAFGSPAFLGQLFVDDGVASLDGIGSVPVGRGVWNDYQLILNFSTQTETALVNGQYIGSEAFQSFATGLNPVQGLVIGINSSPGTDSGFWDNVSVVSMAPEPSSSALLFCGLIAAAILIPKARFTNRSRRSHSLMEQ